MVRGYGRKIRRKIEKCKFTDEVTDLLVRRIRKMPEYADCKIEAFGPMGLGATCSVHVERAGELIGFLTVGYSNRSEFGDFTYVDYEAPRKNTYPLGSIGDLNGFNLQTKDLPRDIDEAVRLVFKIKEDTSWVETKDDRAQVRAQDGGARWGRKMRHKIKLKKY